MKRTIRMILIVGAALPLVGCASYEGGTPDQTDTMSSAGQGTPAPANSPSFRSGLNREDPRDSHFINRPQPEGPYVP